MKFSVQLDAAERERLNALISKGKAPAKMILKARILLKTDATGIIWKAGENLDLVPCGL